MISYYGDLDGIKLAYRYNAGKGPMIVFLPGYMSDMAGSKATAIFDWAKANGRACLLFDYAGCGESEGDFKNGSLTRWRTHLLFLIEHVGGGDVVLVGSSMGGWMMAVAGIALATRLKGLVGIAAAPDFTRWGYTDDQRAEILAKGVLYEDNPYGPEPTPIWRSFFEDAERQLLLDRTIAITCPIRLLHGQADTDVPWEISIRYAAAFQSDDVQVTLVKDGDHRLSRDSDIALLLTTVAEICGG
jgi:pimeloyl-ACP methyl ester carboxylesterase